MTVEPQPAGPTFARSARVHDVRTYIYIYIYIKNIYIYMTKIFPHCTISVGLAPLADNNPEPQKAASHDQHRTHSETIKEDARKQYKTKPELKRRAARKQ